MSDELGDRANFPWESNQWALSNSENSGGSDDTKGKKPPVSGSNTPTPTTTPALTPIPTPTATPSTPVGPKRNRHGASKKGKGGSGLGGGESDHEIHIWTERERRKKMRNMFANLHALLPQLPPKADKSTIVDEAVSYIKKLQVTLQKLQKQKLERLQGAATICSDPPMLIENAVTPNALTSNSTREAYLAEQVSSLNLGVQANASNSLAIVPTFPICFQTWSSPNVVLNVCGEDAHITVCAPKKFGLHTTIQCVLEKHNIDVITFTISSDIYRSMFTIHAHASAISDPFQQVLPVEEIFKLAVGEIMFWIAQ